MYIYVSAAEALLTNLANNSRNLSFCLSYLKNPSSCHVFCLGSVNHCVALWLPLFSIFLKKHVLNLSFIKSFIKTSDKRYQCSCLWKCLFLTDVNSVCSTLSHPLMHTLCRCNSNFNVAAVSEKVAMFIHTCIWEVLHSWCTFISCTVVSTSVLNLMLIKPCQH